MTKTRQDNNITNCMRLVNPKPTLNYCNLSDQVWFMMKKKQDNDIIDHTHVVYVKNKIKLL